MAGTVSHKLSNSFEGALAGGGDPATSPLYVFGPFLKLIVVAGVAQVTFGTSIWLVVFTIATVSAMYRLVMGWVTDGSGGSGLSEEEFGSWAVKINAAITFVEYTLTFLVSMAAMVTFIADRAPVLNESLLGIQYRTLVAIALSLLTGWLVNRGPKTAARAFGPATAGVLLLLWTMIITTIIREGLHLPDFNWQALSGEYIHFTFGGFTRMLAVMTGIEVFANLVAAYGGSSQEKSRRAFGSLLIIMGTTAATMLVVGPEIFRLSDPTNLEVSVFTQTMDSLLPQPLPYLGTLIGIAVLLSASAASAQGLQNLALGLKDRNYIPAVLGNRNRYDVADKPVWLEVGLVIVIFLLAGTHEETYLAIYAAGVFVLLSMTGWAATKRLVRQLRQSFSLGHALVLVGTVLAAAITTVATVVIFEERFFEGAWTYFVFIPLLYAAFSYFRQRVGRPTPEYERLGGLEGAMQGGFGFGQKFALAMVNTARAVRRNNNGGNPIPTLSGSSGLDTKTTPPRHILVPLDGSPFAEQALPAAQSLCQAYGAKLTLLSVLQTSDLMQALPVTPGLKMRQESGRAEKEAYLEGISGRLKEAGVEVKTAIRTGRVAESVNALMNDEDIDMVVISTHGATGLTGWLMGSVATQVVQRIVHPVLVVRPVEGASPPVPQFKRLLVTLDGSEFAERVLPFVRAAAPYKSEIILLRVPHIPEAQMFGAEIEAIAALRRQAEREACAYLEKISHALKKEGFQTRTMVKGSRPAQTIVAVAEEEQAEVIMLATHGHGGLDRLFVGSVAERVVQHTRCPVFLVPIHERRASN